MTALAAGISPLAGLDVLPAWANVPIIIAVFALTGVGTVIAVSKSEPAEQLPAGEGAPVQPAEPEAPPGPPPAAGAGVYGPVGRTAVPAPSATVPEEIVAGKTSFRGREKELAWLRQRHAEGRRERAEGDTTVRSGALLILLHGRPGVGKSALARTFAREIADQYEDGQVYANLGSAGNRRPPGEVLEELIRAFGWTEELPASTEWRTTRLRSLLTGRKVLLVLDAARDADQVLPVLPAEPGCTVIVTSRRNLKPALRASAPSLLVDVPSRLDAVAILRAAADRTDAFEEPVCAAETVQHCGRLPIALVCAGERVAAMSQPQALCAVADRLERAGAARLRYLRFGNWNLEKRLDSEFGRLTPAERRALRLLALVQSETFVPWVLEPLLETSPAEAEALAARLYEAQFIDVAGADRRVGLPRYQFHPLLRLYARERFNELDVEDRDRARSRLEDAYLQAIDDVLTELHKHEGFVRRHRPAQRLPYFQTSYAPSLAESIERSPAEWVRAEYANLVAAVDAAADRDEPGMCWRVAVRLGDGVPFGVDSARVLRAFDRALHAAAAEPGRYAVAAVTLAKGTFLAGIEHYDEGLQLLAAAARADDNDDPALAIVRLTAQRRIGEAFLRIGLYSEAATALEVAKQLAVTASPDATAGPEAEAWESERTLIELLDAEASGCRNAAEWPARARYDEIRHSWETDTDSPAGYLVHLGLSEAARRRGDWGTAEGHLKAALLQHTDSRRAALADYRRARLALSRARHAPAGEEQRQLTRAAIDRAAAAVLAFRLMDSRVGAIRSRCLLAEALVLADRLDEASGQLRSADEELLRVRAVAECAADVVGARIRRAKGALHLAGGDFAQAEMQLDRAREIFKRHDDWAMTAEVGQMLGRAAHRSGKSEAAVTVLLDVAAEYDRAGDQIAVEASIAELAVIFRLNGNGHHGAAPPA
ncbi:NB-ARC domain-containing protein [Dactylosporangium sp. NPDC051541]|uniref:NB-ARC domain-containing protein n=1 Tax=Dactylosporangium sp. NPDC051541 TaxID=3363977 RepID=UPI0037B27BE9